MVKTTLLPVSLFIALTSSVAYAQLGPKDRMELKPQTSKESKWEIRPQTSRWRTWTEIELACLISKVRKMSSWFFTAANGDRTAHNSSVSWKAS
jgi:hypothetical protein